MKKILPIAEPSINYIPWTNNISAIINTNYSKYGDCLYKKFIQMANHGNHRLMFDEYNLTLDVYDCFLPFSLPMHLYGSKKELKEELIDLIIRGYYIYTNVQTYYIKAYSSYMNNYFYHDMLIFGVDTDNKTFMCADFFKTQYAFESCDIDEVVDAIFEHTSSEHGGGMPYFNNLVCFKLIEEYGDLYYSDNTNKILTSLYSLLGENLIVNKEGKDIYPRFGLSVFDSVISRLVENSYEEDTINDSYYLYRMNFHFFQEHIKHMKNRIIYLCGDENKYHEKNFATCDELCEILLSSRNMIIKYILDPTGLSIDTRKKLAHDLLNVKQQYANVIQSLINYLEML